jgi:hypothetical protein
LHGVDEVLGINSLRDRESRGLQSMRQGEGRKIGPERRLGGALTR